MPVTTPGTAMTTARNTGSHNKVMRPVSPIRTPSLFVTTPGSDAFTMSETSGLAGVDVSAFLARASRNSSTAAIANRVVWGGMRRSALSS